MKLKSLSKKVACISLKGFFQVIFAQLEALLFKSLRKESYGCEMRVREKRKKKVFFWIFSCNKEFLNFIAEIYQKSLV